MEIIIYIDILKYNLLVIMYYKKDKKNKKNKNKITFYKKFLNKLIFFKCINFLYSFRW